MKDSSLTEILLDGFIGHIEENAFRGGGIAQIKIAGKFSKCIFYDIWFTELSISSSFVNCTFTNCSFTQCKIENASFTNSDFTSCSLDNTNEIINTKFDGGGYHLVDTDGLKIRASRFESCKFGHSKLNGISFVEDTKFHKCVFENTEISNCLFNVFSFADCRNFKDVSLLNNHFLSGVFSSCEIQTSTFKKSIFDSVTFNSTKIQNATFPETVFKKINCRKIIFNEIKEIDLKFADQFKFSGNCQFFAIDLSGFNFSNSQLSGSQFNTCQLIESDFKNSNLCNVKFMHCDISKADFRYSKVDTISHFQNVTCDNTKIELYQIKKLQGNGGFTDGQLADMKIEDGLLKLKENFTGFLQWLHLISIILFLAPYLSFLFYLSYKSNFFTHHDETGRKIINVFGEYIYSGGRMDGEMNVVSLLTFSLLVFYNISRFVLLYKTKELELKQNSTGFLVRFSIDSKIKIFGKNIMKYSQLFWLVKKGFIVNLIIVLIHLLLFLNRPVNI